MASLITSLHVDIVRSSAQIDKILNIKNSPSEVLLSNLQELLDGLDGSKDGIDKDERLAKIINVLKKCHGENAKLLKGLEDKISRVKAESRTKAALESKKVAPKRSVQQSTSNNSLLTANIKASRAPTAITAAKTSSSDKPSVSRSSRRGQRGTLMDLPSAPSPAVLRSTASRTRTTTPKTRDALSTLSSSASKRSTANAKARSNKTSPKASAPESPLGGGADDAEDGELDRSGPLLTIGQIGAIMQGGEGRSAKGGDNTENEGEVNALKIDVEADAGLGSGALMTKLLSPSKSAGKAAAPAIESFSSPSPISGRGRGRGSTDGNSNSNKSLSRYDSTPETPEMDQSLRSAMERINQSTGGASATDRPMDESCGSVGANRSLRTSQGLSLSTGKSTGAGGQEQEQETPPSATALSSARKGYESDESVEFDYMPPPAPSSSVPASAEKGQGQETAAKKSPWKEHWEKREQEKDLEMRQEQQEQEQVQEEQQQDEEGGEEEGGEHGVGPVPRVSYREFETTPSYIRYQTTLGDINKAIRAINCFVTAKAKAQTQTQAQVQVQGFVFSEAEIEALVAEKANVLGLVILKRLEMLTCSLGVKTFAVPSLPQAGAVV